MYILNSSLCPRHEISREETMTKLTTRNESIWNYKFITALTCSVNKRINYYKGEKIILTTVNNEIADKN